MTQTSSPMRKNETKTNILSAAHSPSDAHGNYPSDAPLFLLIIPLSTYRIKDFLIGGRRQAFVLKTLFLQNYRPLSVCQTNPATQPMETSPPPAFRPSQITKKDRSNLESVFLKIASRCAMNAMQQFIQYLVKHFRFLI